MLVFHVFSFLFQVLDHANLLQTYKIYPPTEHTPTYRQMLPRVLFNQIFLLLPACLLCHRLNLSFPDPSIPFQPSHHQSSPTVLTSLLIMFIVPPLLHEFAFYVAHRFILHHPWGFSRFNHALHHATKAHSALSAMYMSPSDFLLEIILPYLLPLIVVSRLNLMRQPHIICMLPLGALGGLYEHSGYNFFGKHIPFLDTRVHGLHHLHYTCSFADGVGAPSIFDSTFHTVCASLGPMPAASNKLLQIFMARNKSDESNHSTLPSTDYVEQLIRTRA